MLHPNLLFTQAIGERTALQIRLSLQQASNEKLWRPSRWWQRKRILKCLKLLDDLEKPGGVVDTLRNYFESLHWKPTRADINQMFAAADALHHFVQTIGNVCALL